MTPLHYAALFDSAPIAHILLKAYQGVDIDSPCNEYENGRYTHSDLIAPVYLAAIIILSF